MITFLAIVGGTTVAWGFWRFVRILWFRTRTLQILTHELSYEAAVPGFQNASFNAVTAATMQHGGNHYDAAITFMLVQFDGLSVPLDMKARMFLEEKLGLIHSIVDKSGHGHELVKDFLVRHHAKAKT